MPDAGSRRAGHPGGPGVSKGEPVKVWLVMLVERDTEGWVSGDIFEPGGGTLESFSGTAQMLAAMENMVPSQRPVHEGARPVGPSAGRGLAAGPVGG